MEESPATLLDSRQRERLRINQTKQSQCSLRKWKIYNILRFNADQVHPCKETCFGFGNRVSLGHGTECKRSSYLNEEDTLWLAQIEEHWKK